jgi:hypothetical protein
MIDHTAVIESIIMIMLVDIISLISIKGIDTIKIIIDPKLQKEIQVTNKKGIKSKNFSCL